MTTRDELAAILTKKLGTYVDPVLLKVNRRETAERRFLGGNWSWSVQTAKGEFGSCQTMTDFVRDAKRGRIDIAVGSELVAVKGYPELNPDLEPDDAILWIAVTPIGKNLFHESAFFAGEIVVQSDPYTLQIWDGERWRKYGDSLGFVNFYRRN